MTAAIFQQLPPYYQLRSKNSCEPLLILSNTSKNSKFKMDAENQELRWALYCAIFTHWTHLYNIKGYIFNGLLV